MHFIAVPYTFSYGITSTQLLRFYMILESGLFLSRIRRGMGKNGSQVYPVLVGRDAKRDVW